MVEFIEMNSIGVSKDSQVRAARILKVISDGYEFPNPEGVGQFFHFGRRMLADRWQRLRQALDTSGRCSLPRFSLQFCEFSKEHAQTYPGICNKIYNISIFKLICWRRKIWLVFFFLLKVLHGLDVRIRKLRIAKLSLRASMCSQWVGDALGLVQSLLE